MGFRFATHEESMAQVNRDWNKHLQPKEDVPMSKFLIINSHHPLWDTIEEAIKSCNPRHGGGLDKGIAYPEGPPKTLVIEIGAVTVIEPTVTTHPGDVEEFINTPAFRIEAEQRYRDQCADKVAADVTYQCDDPRAQAKQTQTGGMGNYRR